MFLRFPFKKSTNEVVKLPSGFETAVILSAGTEAQRMFAFIVGQGPGAFLWHSDGTPKGTYPLLFGRGKKSPLNWLSGILFLLQEK